MTPPASIASRLKRRLTAAYRRGRHRLGIAEPGPGPSAIAASFRHPIDASRKADLIASYLRLFPVAAGKEIAEAGRLLRHEFTFLGHTWTHGESIAWSRDPVSGRDWNAGFSPDITFRGPGRLGDIKLPWELNKHQYFFTLGKSAWLTGKKAGAEEIVRQINHWIEANPYRRGINWISALESGTRAVSWILAYPFYADSTDEAFRARLSRAIAQHMTFVEEHLSTGPHANNHLIGDAAALVIGGLFLNHRHRERWLEKGLRHLEAEIQRQVSADGVHLEQSVAYHRFVLDQYHLVDAFLRSNDHEFSAAARARMSIMTEFLMDALSPDGRSPGIGDGDDARGVWLHAESPGDFRAPLALGAVIFRRGDFKQISGGLAEEVLWLLGEEGVDAFRRLDARTPDHISVAYPRGGYYVMRGGWNASDPVMVCDCGPLGYGPAGHGHADALSVQLHAGGYPFLVDPGAYSYNLDYDWRHVFRSTRAHNTVVVDGADQSVPDGRMAWSVQAEARANRWISNPSFDLLDGEHAGYRRLADPVTHRRVVIYLKPDVWIVVDSLTAAQTHAAEWLWHLRPDCEVRTGPARIALRSPEGRQLHVSMADLDGHLVEPRVLEADDTAAWFAPRYGVRVPSRTLSVQREFARNCGMVTCLTQSADAIPAVDQDGGVLRVRLDRPGALETLTYRGQMRPSAGEEFNGNALFQRHERGHAPAVRATEFTRLRVEGVLTVAANTLISSLTLEGNSCEIVATAPPADLRFDGRDDVTVTVKPVH